MRLVLCNLFLVTTCLLAYSSAVPCRDTNQNCKDWARKGECQRNQRYMKDNCKMSCNLCVTSPVRVVSSPNVRCVDKHRNCGVWSRRGECRKNVWMKSNCKKSCRLCTVVVTSATTCQKGCRDLKRNCAYWAGRGYCNSNPVFMKANCKCSCRTCGRTSFYPWGRWSKCDKNCKKFRQRKCAIGWTCFGGSRVQRVKCTTGICSKPQKCSEWGSWSSTCSIVDGVSVSKRTRKCPANIKDGIELDYKSCDKIINPTIPTAYSGKKEYNSLNCGKPYEDKTFPIGRIVGGKVSLQGAWPWQVALLRRPQTLPANWKEAFMKTDSFCGGILISSRVVLTAAHCIEVDDRKYYLVRVGDWNSKQKEAQERVIKVKKLIRHPGFTRKTYANDIAMFILEEEVTLDKMINAACLPDKLDFQNPSLNECFVTGWGRLEAYGKRPNILQQAKLPIVNSKVCNSAYLKVVKNVDKVITDNMLCAGFKKGGIDACQGDSGGPFVCKQGDQYVLQGIVSFGIGCASPEKYGVYTRVSKYMDWIKKQIYEGL